MIEIRYNNGTKVVTGWCADPGQWHHLDRGRDETIVYLDIPIPEKVCLAYLYDEATKSLISNPDYVELVPPRDLATEIDNLKVKVEKLEKK